MRILLLEDGLKRRTRIHQLLARMGHEVVRATDAGQACEILQGVPSPVALVDVREVPNGEIHFCDRLRDVPLSRRPHVILVIDPPVPGRCSLPPQADDLLVRPVRTADLAARLALAGRRIGDPTPRAEAEPAQLACPGTVPECEPAQSSSPPDPAPANGLLHRLQDALQARRIQAYYQPLVSARDRAVRGFEALVRWHEPDLGWVRPDRFVPMAEARGLIVELGRQVAGAAFRQLAAWRDAGHLVGISINISKRQLQEEAFCDEMRDLARDHRLIVDWITFEVTERQSLLHDPDCRRSLEQLASVGFRLSLDDFGSGYSAFDMVAEIPFRELKIDMGLCRQADSPRTRPIVQAIVEMCQTMEVDSVAEGIETAELARVFEEMGVSLLQGYHFSAPMCGDAALDFLRK
jgi:EAL domain-containing protein (putative c-di-GMP-specific phosphodiesterase class I)